MKRWLITVLPLGALIVLVAVYGVQMARQAPAGAPAPATAPAATLAPTLPPPAAAREVLIYDLGLGWLKCASAVTRALGRAPGVIDFELNTMDDVTRVVYDPARTSIKQIVAVVSVTGHQPSEVVDVEP